MTRKWVQKWSILGPGGRQISDPFCSLVFLPPRGGPQGHFLMTFWSILGIILEVFWVYVFDVFLVVALLFFNGLGLVFLWLFYFPPFFSRFFCELKRGQGRAQRGRRPQDL